MDITWAAGVVNMMIALIISLTFHEAAHALMARMQGDPTAQREGRLTLNPIPHMDPIGTIFFPLLGAMGGGFLFGWAKPVPIDPRNFRNQKWGNILVASAGPMANMVLSIVAIFAVRMLGDTQEGTLMIGFLRLAEKMIWVNAILAVFNLLPVYPLDGGTIIYELLSSEMREKYDQYVVPYGSFALLGLMLVGGLSWLGHVAGVWVFVASRIVGLVI